MYEEFQIVKSTKKLSHKVLEGCIGTIVYVHSGYPQAYEVEFCDLENETIDVLTVTEDDITSVE